MKKLATWLKYSWVLFKKRSILTVLVILQLAITIFGVGTMIRYISSQNVVSGMTRALSTANGLYYIGSSEVIENEQIADTDLIMNVYSATSEVGSMPTEIRAYSGKIHSLVDIPLYKGKWFGDGVKEEVEVVVSQTFGLQPGEKINIRIGEQTVNCVVIGVLTKQFYHFKLSGGSSIGDNMTTKFLWEHYDETRNLIYLSAEQMKDKKITGFTAGGGYYINFRKDITPQTLQANMETLRANGSVAFIDTMIRNSESEYRMTLSVFLPVLILFLLLLVCSMVLVIALILQASEQTLSILYLNGADRQDLYGIVLVYGMIMAVIADILYLLADFVLLNGYTKNFGQSTGSLIAMFVLNIIQVAGITAISRNKIRSKSILSALKEEV